MKSLIIMLTLSVSLSAHAMYECRDINDMPLVLNKTEKDIFTINTDLVFEYDSYFAPGRYNYTGVEAIEEVKTNLTDGKFKLEAQRYIKRSFFAIETGHNMGVYPQRPGRYGDQTIINIDLNTGKGTIAEFILNGRNKTEQKQVHGLKNCKSN